MPSALPLWDSPIVVIYRSVVRFQTGNRSIVYSSRPLRRNALQNTLQGIFSKKYPKNIPKTPRMAHKKLFEDERLFAKDEGNMDYKDFISSKRDSSLSF